MPVSVYSLLHQPVPASPNNCFPDQVKSVCLPVTGNFRLIFSMEADAIACPRLYSTLTYTITNPILNIKLAQYQPDYLNRLTELASKGGMLLNYSSQYHSSQICDASSNTISVGFAMKSARVAITVCRLPSEFTQAAYNNYRNIRYPVLDRLFGSIIRRAITTQVPHLLVLHLL